jgi:K+-sensing histidine kinase KdpD
MIKASTLRGYAVAVIACGIALMIARPLNAESSCFVLAVIVSSLYGGRGPGLLAVGLSAIAFDVFFLPSPLTLSSAPSSYLRFAVFLVVAFTASQLIETKRRSEDALRTIQARLSRATRFATVAELAASIAHEVSQPLSAVVANGQACIQWLSAEPPNVGNAQAAAQRIIHNGNDAAEVVRHIRALFRKTALEKADLDINEVIGEVLRLIHKETVEKRIASCRIRGSGAAAAGDLQFAPQWNRSDGNGCRCPQETLHLFQVAGFRCHCGGDPGLWHWPGGFGKGL